MIDGSHHIAQAREIFTQECVIGECAGIALGENDYRMGTSGDGSI